MTEDLDAKAWWTMRCGKCRRELGLFGTPDEEPPVRIAEPAGRLTLCPCGSPLDTATFERRRDS